MYGYLATESSRDTSRGVGSLNNSGNTEKECVRRSGHKSQSANISWGMRFVVVPSKVVDSGSIKVRIDPMAEVSFPVRISTVNANEKRSLLAGNISLKSLN